MRIDWQQHLRRTVLDLGPGEDEDAARGRTPVNYVDIGAGERAIVLVHGISGCWQNFLETIPALAEHHRVLAFDLPGFGGSPMPDWPISIPNYGRVVNRFCAELGLTDVVLVGNSMGGFISVEAVLREPERFAHLVLLAAAGISSATVRARPIETVVRILQAMTPLVLEFQKRTVRRPRIRSLGFDGVFLHPRALRYELLVEQLRGGTGRPAFLPAMQAMLGYDVLDEIGGIEVPTTIVCGRQDRIVPPRDAAVYAERISGSRLEVYEDCGHLPQLERPVRFNRLLEGIASGVSP